MCNVCYLTKETTPVRTAREIKSVKIIDPRHSLCGQSFRLVSVSQSGKEGSVCTIELQSNIWRRIPLDVTDLGRHTPPTYPLPLTLSVVRELLEVFEHIAMSGVMPVD